MKNHYICWGLLFLVPLALPAQVTFYNDVWPIVQQKCGTCHKPQGAAPFSLTDYASVNKRASFILDVIESGYMPPYPADPSFAEHANANFLKKEEIALLKQWIKEGKKEGKKASGEDASFNAIAAGAKADLLLKRKIPFVVPGDNQEKFKIFVLPTNLHDTAYVSAIEFVPGNAQRTHHSRIMLDTSTKLRSDDGIDVGEESALQKNNVNIYDEFWKGWVPGNSNLVLYPPGMAKVLPPQTDLVINTHYAAGPLDEKDDFVVKLYFAGERPRRIIRNFILEEQSIRNGPLMLPPDTVITFYMQSPPIPFAISLISVLPHMHALGKSFKAFAITPAGDVVPLISIPKWQFNWQLTYPFKSLLKIPQGSIVYVQATFDNTRNNPANPNSPPKPVYKGWGTKDEMLNLIMEYVEYEPGDELISTQMAAPPASN